MSAEHKELSPLEILTRVKNRQRQKYASLKGFTSGKTETKLGGTKDGIKEGIEPQYVKIMRALAVTIDELLNSPLSERKNGFVLMVFPFENFDGCCNFISNADKKSVYELMKVQIDNFKAKGEPDDRSNDQN